MQSTELGVSSDFLHKAHASPPTSPVMESKKKDPPGLCFENFISSILIFLISKFQFLSEYESVISHLSNYWNFKLQSVFQFQVFLNPFFILFLLVPEKSMLNLVVRTLKLCVTKKMLWLHPLFIHQGLSYAPFPPPPPSYRKGDKKVKGKEKKREGRNGASEKWQHPIFIPQGLYKMVLPFLFPSERHPSEGKE